MSRPNTVDFLAGLFVILIGTMAIVESLNFQMGTSRNMGPGYFPYYIGIFMLLLGAGLILEAFRSKSSGATSGNVPRPRALLLILAAVVAFALTVQRFGMAPATAVAVFLGTLADNESSMLQKLALTVAVPFVSVLIFKFGLGMTVDVFRWRP